MIKPEDLLALAHRLAAATKEPEGRAAVGRAYYAAFHFARILVEVDCGVILPEGPDIHRKLLFCLDESGHDRLVAIADKLSSLRGERNRADYKLQDSRYADPVNVKSQLGIAEDIIGELRAAHAELAAFRNSVRMYANTVLKLRLTGA